jgi:hypothetical protein
MAEFGPPAEPEDRVTSEARTRRPAGVANSSYSLSLEAFNHETFVAEGINSSSWTQLSFEVMVNSQNHMSATFIFIPYAAKSGNMLCLKEILL